MGAYEIYALSATTRLLTGHRTVNECPKSANSEKGSSLDSRKQLDLGHFPFRGRAQLVVATPFRDVRWGGYGVEVESVGAGADR
ncbi:hypothetical protein ACIBCL_14660, partial [Micromonospora zamorensis]|uniref:hypothetical protein n=1 Tax=Micromonospora zamorensis TaxID=709883 RepID=UPI00379CC8A3